MRMIVKTSNEDSFSILLRKIKGLGLDICKENKKWNFITVNIPQAKSNILYELLELGGTIERDVRNDLD
jgi:hypothetical protein